MFPKLVRNPHTPVRVIITDEDINEYGEQLTILDKNFLCNYQDSATKKYTKNKESTEITGRIFIDGDILPSKANITGGQVIIFGVTRLIAKGDKCRNFDGTVNYTKLEVI